MSNYNIMKLLNISQRGDEMKKEVTMNRWVMLAAHIVINFILGGVYAFSFFKTPLIDKFHWDPAMLALAFSINMGIIPIPMILGGKLIDDGKGKLAIIIGGILFSLGFILSGFVTTLPMLLLTYGVIAGFGSGLAFTGNLNNIMKFFPDKRGLASGLVLSGVGIGTLLCTEIAKFFMKSNDITNSLLYLGIVYLVVLFVVQFFIRSAPASTSNKIPASKVDADWKTMLKTSRFWILFSILAMGCFAGVVISSTSAQIGMEQFGLKEAAIIVSSVSICNSVGRIFWGFISDKLGPFNAIVVVYGLLGIAMAGLLMINGAVPYFVIASFIGFTYAGVLTIYPSLTSINFGLKHQGINYAFMYFGFAVGSVFSPYVTSYIGKENHNYDLSFIISIVLMVVSIGLIFVAKKMTEKIVHKGE